MTDTLHRLLEITTVMEILQESDSREEVLTGAIVADAAGRILHATDGACTIFGYEAAAMRALSLEELMPVRYRALHRAAFGRVASGEPSRLAGKSVELTGLTADGTEVAMAFRLSIRDTPELGRLYVGRIWSMRGIDRSVLIRVEAGRE